MCRLNMLRAQNSLSLHPSKHETFTDVGPKLAHRLRRWSNIEPTLGERLVFAEILYLYHSRLNALFRNIYSGSLGFTERVNIVLRRFLHNHDNSATEGSPKLKICPSMTSRVLCTHNDIIVEITAHCTVQIFEQFGALYMHKLDDKYPTRPRFKSSTCWVSSLDRIEWPSGPKCSI